MIRKYLISNEEIKTAQIQGNIADRPSQKTLYGGRTMTPSEIKAAYDKLPKLIAKKLNDLIQSIPGVKGGMLDDDSLAAMILTGIKEGHTLKDLFEEIRNGTFQAGNIQNGKTPFIGNNGNWWIGDTDTGVRAEGKDGTPFRIVATYKSIETMQAAHSTDRLLIGSYVLIDTGDKDDDDYGKLFIKGENEYEFVVDMTGPTVNGKSAYEIAVELGFGGSQAEWLASLKGECGISIIGAVLEKISDDEPTEPDEPDTPTIISFTINGVPYHAESGWNWGTWYSSEYNTSDFELSGNTIMYGDNDPITLNGKPITTADGIQPNAAYKSMSYNSAAVIREFTYNEFGYATYQFEEGMTWEEWVNSPYNTVGFVVNENNTDNTELQVIQDPRDLDQAVCTSSATPVRPNHDIVSGETYGLTSW